MRSASLKITENPDPLQWGLFVAQHPQGNIFQSPALYNLYRSSDKYQPGVLALEDADHQIKGVLLYNIIQEPGIKSYFTGRSIITAGPLVDNDNTNLTALLLNAYVQKIRSTRVIYTQVRNLWPLQDLQPIFSGNGFRYIDHLNVHIDLTRDESQLMQDMHKKRYSNILRAKKRGLVVRVPDEACDLEAVIGLIRKTYKRINIPCPPRELFLNACGYLGSQVVFATAYYGDIMVACRMYVAYKGVMYDWYAASDLQYAHLYPNDLLPWESMLWAKLNNYTVYDFGGAGNPHKPYGVRDYKIRFGGAIINTGRYQAIHKPALFAIGKMGIRLLKYIS